MKETPTLEDALRTAGLAVTKQRLALLKVLRTLSQPVSVEVLTKKLAKLMNTTTVYRALEQLVQVGLVRRVDLGENHALFEAAGAHHHHIVCRSCGRVDDVDACLPTGLSARILSQTPAFSTIETHALEFFGVCRTCDTGGR